MNGKSCSSKGAESVAIS